MTSAIRPQGTWHVQRDVSRSGRENGSATRRNASYYGNRNELGVSPEGATTQSDVGVDATTLCTKPGGDAATQAPIATARLEGRDNALRLGPTAPIRFVWSEWLGFLCQKLGSELKGEVGSNQQLLNVLPRAREAKWQSSFRSL